MRDPEIVSAFTIMQRLYQSDLLKRELSCGAKPSMDSFIFITALTFGDMIAAEKHLGVSHCHKSIQLYSNHKFHIWT